MIFTDDSTRRFCLAGKGAEGDIADALTQRGFCVIILPPDEELPVPVADHADLSVFYSGRSLIMRSSYDKKYNVAGFLRRNGLPLPTVFTDAPAGAYPLDTALCAKSAGAYLICREKSTAPEVIGAAGKNGLRILNVRQGYAACSVSVLYDGSLITGDRGIAAEARKQGVETLLTERGHILLPGYGDGLEGFIGGCTGLYGKYLYFTGNLSLHPEGERIASFCREHGTEPVSLSTGPLRDIGGLIFV